MDHQRCDWLSWPQHLQDEIGAEDVDAAAVNYHLYAQWIAAEQLMQLKYAAEADDCGLYLDLPVGVDPGGYDVWRNKDLFVLKATTGAPPDPFFTKGQDWGLPPLHPERIREHGYTLLRQVLAAHMRFARYLRIDHAMGWHRLYCIPHGAGPGQGAYVRYHAEEFYAVASLESHRHECTLLAENMGTVPPEVNESLDRHGIGGMWVAPYELEPSRRQALFPPPKLSVASLNTHDMPPAAAWWQGLDIADRQSLGLLTAEQAEGERLDRREATEMLKDWLRRSGAYPLQEEGQGSPPVAALLRCLAKSHAQLVLVNLEDLWLETRSQNVPGTLHERPNWQRKARYSLEECTQRPDVLDILADVNNLRGQSDAEHCEHGQAAGS
jgi:4-alpha-glucanotransferase